IQAAQRPLQPKTIPAVQYSNHTGLMLLYKSCTNFIPRSIECRRHDTHLHQPKDSVILVAASPLWASAVNPAFPTFGCGFAAPCLCGEYSSASMILHCAPFDFQKTFQAAGCLRGFHLLVGTARTQERVHFPLRQTFIGLAHGFDHSGESRAGGGGEAVAKTCEIARRVEESCETVRRREGHERRWQPLADDAHLLGISCVDEKHVSARFVKRFRATQGLVEIVDPPCVCPSDDQEIGVGAACDRLGDLL